MIDIKSMLKAELSEALKCDGYPAYRAEQVYLWLAKGVSSFEQMLNVPKDLRQQLSEKYYIASAEVERKFSSKVDETVKYLFRLRDGEFVEAVLMKYKHGYTICISTQVGCKMGCKFCATGKGGFVRNLTASEMLAQIQSAQLDNDIRISNVVLMGMGEPLDNYDNVLRFLRLVSAPEGFNIGMRHISLSTCGIIDKMRALANERLQLTLSVSLHAPNDDLRNQLMPINKRFGVEELLEACRFYIEKTGRRISFEYAMISGVNDDDACANELARKLAGMLCHVNLIPVNGIEATKSTYKKSSRERLDSFVRILAKRGITATVRRTLGADINASCGQLRGKAKNQVV